MNLSQVAPLVGLYPDFTEKGYSWLGSTPVKQEPCKSCRQTAQWRGLWEWEGEMNKLVFANDIMAVDMCIKKLHECEKHWTYVFKGSKWGKRWAYYMSAACRILKGSKLD